MGQLKEQKRARKRRIAKLRETGKADDIREAEGVHDGSGDDGEDGGSDVSSRRSPPLHTP